MKTAIKDIIFSVRHGFRGFPIEIGECQFRVDESLRRWNFASEEDVRICLEQNLNPGDVAIDVGANFGMHTLIMCNAVGTRGRVFAYEPIPTNIRLLEKNIGLNQFGDQVEIRRAAISDLGQSHVDMAVDQQGLDPAASLIGSTHEEHRSHTIRVQNHSLDADFEHLDTANNCLIKIDVEGAELSVLRSGKKLLKRVQPKLLIEIHDYALPSFGESTESVYAFLNDYGYEIHQITDMNNHNGQYHHVLALWNEEGTQVA